jgi:hypothetical protein
MRSSAAILLLTVASWTGEWVEEYEGYLPGGHGSQMFATLVVDERTGEPLPGATLRIYKEDIRPEAFPGRFVEEFKADRYGVVWLRWEERFFDCHFVFDHPGYAAEDEYADVPLWVGLAPGREVRGRILGLPPQPCGPPRHYGRGRTFCPAGHRSPRRNVLGDRSRHFGGLSRSRPGAHSGSLLGAVSPRVGGHGEWSGRGRRRRPGAGRGGAEPPDVSRPQDGHRRTRAVPPGRSGERKRDSVSRQGRPQSPSDVGKERLLSRTRAGAGADREPDPDPPARRRGAIRILARLG